MSFDFILRILVEKFDVCDQDEFDELLAAFFFANASKALVDELFCFLERNQFTFVDAVEVIFSKNLIFIKST